jgi:hypothetical protein
VVNLPDQTMLAMDEPDDEGRWVCKLARHVYVTFDHRDHGDVESFELHEVHSLPRKVVPEVGDADAPADLVPFLGRYHLAALTADFLVSWQKGKLVLGHPQSDHPLPLEPTGENGVWRTVNGPYTISFVTGDEGQVESLTLDAASEFRKK